MRPENSHAEMTWMHDHTERASNLNAPCLEASNTDELEYEILVLSSTGVSKKVKKKRCEQKWAACEQKWANGSKCEQMWAKVSGGDPA